VNAEVDYGALIERHVRERLHVFSSDKVAKVLALTGLTTTPHGVLCKDANGPSAETAYAYKRAIRQVFGAGVYEMTKVNFELAGCRCVDCAGGPRAAP
jgi:hypothetical protein